MDQQISERKRWVLVSSLKENTGEQDIEAIRSGISDLIDQWQSQGRIMWSGALNDNKTGIAIFEGTDSEANQMYEKYDKICFGVLEYSMHQWDAMPILSFLE